MVDVFAFLYPGQFRRGPPAQPSSSPVRLQPLRVAPTCRMATMLDRLPFLSSNIPSSPAYGVFISQLIRYARACSSYECFILRAARLSSKFLRQGVMGRLKSSLRKFYGRYGDLIKHYEVSLSQMLHDILGHDHIQWHPQLIRHYTNLRNYSIEHCNGCG